MLLKTDNDRHQASSYPLRLPANLKAHLVGSAAQNQRSLNGEIVFRLEESRQRETQQVPQ